MKCSFLDSPEFLSLPIFGLSISQTSIKLIKLKKNKYGYVPTVAIDTPVNETCDFFSNQNSTEDCLEIKKELSSLKKKHKIKFAQVSIPEENTYVFRVSVPVNVISLIDDYLLNNIDQNIPLSASEVYFDYRILENKKNKETVPVVVTAIPKIVVEKYTNLIETCGILSVGCVPETHAISRSVINKGDMNPYIIVNIDESSTKISVVEDSFVQYTQTLPIKTQDIIENILPETGATLREAINKVIIYWFTSKEKNTQNLKIENIIISGVGVDPSNLVNYLESNMSVNAEYANVWKNCFDVNLYVPQVSKSDSLKFATCIGLALSKIK